MADAAQVSDASLEAAARGGVWGNPAFLSIVDDLLLRAPCLCCYRTCHRAVAEEADRQIGLFLRYYSPRGHEKTNAFYRALGSLGRDATAAEAALAGRHPLEGPYENVPAPPPAVAEALKAARALSQPPGLTALAIPHPLGDGWAGLLAEEGVALLLCSTPEARRALRVLARECQRRGLALATRALAGSEGVVPRFLGRYYAVEFHPAARPPPAAATSATPPGAWAAWAATGAAVAQLLREKSPRRQTRPSG